MKHALVTGDAGFVGRHFRRHLGARGWHVTGGDIKHGRDARDLFRHGVTAPSNQPFDLVVHCAAVVGGRETIDGRPLALASNLELDAGLFQWALRYKPRRVIYFSSSAVYPVFIQNESPGKFGTGWQGGLYENMVSADFAHAVSVGVPDQLYGWTKLTGENLAHRARQEGVPVSVVRPFSGYGEDQDTSYPFPAFIDRALRHEDPFDIWGDGTQVRDFIHISDIVHACMVMAEHGIDGPVNLATGRATSMTDLARLMCQAEGYTPDFRYLRGKPRGVSYRLGSPERLKTFYEPEIRLEDGIAIALESRR